MARFNWQGLFVVYGCLGLVWCIFWIPLVSEDPPARQSQYPHGEGIKGVGDVPWEKFVRSTAVWAIFVAQCTQGAPPFMPLNCCVEQMHATSLLVYRVRRSIVKELLFAGCPCSPRHTATCNGAQ